MEFLTSYCGLYLRRRAIGDAKGYEFNFRDVGSRGPDPGTAESNVHPATNMNIKLIKLERLRDGWIARVDISSTLGRPTPVVRLSCPYTPAPVHALIRTLLHLHTRSSMPNARNSQPSSLDRAWSAIAAVLSFLIALIAYLWGRLTGIPGTSSTIDYLEGLRPLLLEMERSVNEYGIQLTDETLYNYNQLEERRQRCVFPDQDPRRADDIDN